MVNTYFKTLKYSDILLIEAIDKIFPDNLIQLENVYTSQNHI